MRENEPLSLESDVDGVITALEAQKKNASRVSVFVDGTFAIGIHRDVAADFKLRQGDTVRSSDLRLLQEANALHEARRSAMELLSYRSRTTAEMHNRLIRKGYPESVATRVVADLEQGGILDDEAFAREFTLQKVESRRVGEYRIRRDLMKRGIDRETADRSVAAHSQDADWRGAAMTIAVRKWESLPATLPVEKKRKRLYDYLARRGFAFELIRSIVHEVAE